MSGDMVDREPSKKSGLDPSVVSEKKHEFTDNAGG